MAKIVFGRKKIRKTPDNSKLISLMSRDLATELRIVKFYEDNIHLFRDRQSREKIMSLVLASLNHAAKFAGEIHRLQPSLKIKLPQSIARRNALFTLGNALREEKGAEEIYKYQSARVYDPKTAETLLQIAGEEKIHQAIVKQIAAEIAKGIPEQKRKQVLSRFRLNQNK